MHAPGMHGGYPSLAKLGGIEVQKPYDVLTGSDMFTDEGREELNALMNDPLLYWEHWAPECKLFSRARGRPIKLPNGKVIQGPQPVRDASHVMGFPWLSGEMKARLRRSNGMALKGLKRLKVIAEERQPRHGTLEHPKNSWLWEFNLVRTLEALGLRHAIGSACCFGALGKSSSPSSVLLRRCSMSLTGSARVMTTYSPMR